ncbi:MAG TPA: type VI secretion system protein TssA [archaeon]|nr:type VI secretion system protein TssA [archaeon]
MDLLELGKSPISETNPAGEDARFEPEFEELENEIGKLSSPTATAGIDWAKVIKLSQDILEKKSKNLLVASYLCCALLQTESLNGLVKGVRVLRDLLENFWETMFPPVKRMRGRTNAVAWWAERISAGIRDIQTEKWPKEKRDSFLGDLEALDSFLAEKLEDGPILRTMNENISSLIEEEAPPPPPPPPPAPAGEAQAPPAPAPAQETAAPVGKKAPTAAPQPPPAQPQEAVSAEDADKLMRQGLNLLGQAASLFFKQGKISVVPFRINRIAAWLPVESLPLAEGTKTLIPPPDEQVGRLLKGMYQLKNWNDLLSAAESRVAQYLFWIDLSRYVVESLEGLGYPVIGEVVASETFSYVTRLSGIEKLAFADGTPFADEETKEWLRSLARQSGGSSSAGGQVYELVDKELSEAQNLIKENKLPQALTAFREKLNLAPSLRERFIWEVGLCRLLLRVKMPRLVLPYCQELIGYLDTYKIERWEPALALEGLTLVLSGLRLQEEEKRDEKLINSILDRVSVLSPSSAMELM